MMPPEDPQDQWPDDTVPPAARGRLLDEQAGPMVRPYVMTSGRIEPTRGEFDLITLVVAVGPEPEGAIGLGPEHLAIIRLCQSVMSVAEITGHLDLPVATVRVMLGDLLDKGFVSMQEPEPEADMHDIRLYKAVIDGLRAL
ncbi:DUF742 domain-containing protein [Actinomadura livida]|uniref:DUF742 domain-containing protein n=1 Tax=Actinomadura livida TaxID=79909 RepID=A0A7W7N1U8_9ACTN|nr:MULTISPECIES: DUF742 domain-containing protein [Actinomadura]MBB4778325.1 hypothetical protein [Actinomadura catellatispora]GGU25316.1 hypothetical protein GCM10010208_57870 [Actinomadura livida]